MTTTEDVITHCDRCKCDDSIHCLASLCRCAQCSCDVDAGRPRRGSTATKETWRDVIYVEVSKEQYDLAKELEQKHRESRQAQGLSEEPPPVEGAKRIILQVRKK